MCPTREFDVVNSMLSVRCCQFDAAPLATRSGRHARATGRSGGSNSTRTGRPPARGVLQAPRRRRTRARLIGNAARLPGRAPCSPDENAPRRPQTDKDTGVGTFVPDPGLDDDADDVGYASGDEAQTAPLEDEESGTPGRGERSRNGGGDSGDGGGHDNGRRRR